MTTHFSWQAAVIASELESTTKLVLLVIGSYMNQHGDGAFPSYATIAKNASLNRATVIRHVDIAVEGGWVGKRSRVRTNADDGRTENDSNLYSISFPLVAESNHPVAESDYPVALADHHGRTERLPVVAQGDSNTPVLTPQGTPQSIEQAFERFWVAGMDKKGRKKALATFKSIVKRDKLDAVEFAAKLEADIRARLKAGQFGFDKQHPTTYLNGERWNDATASPAGKPSAHTNFKDKNYAGTADNEIDWFNAPDAGAGSV